MSSDQPFVLGIWRNAPYGNNLPVGKRLFLDSQCELQKDVIVPDASHMTVEQFSDLPGLRKTVSDYPSCFFTSGVPRYWEEILEQRKNAAPGSDDGWQQVAYKNSLQPGVTRTKDCIPNQPGCWVVAARGTSFRRWIARNPHRGSQDGRPRFVQSPDADLQKLR